MKTPCSPRRSNPRQTGLFWVYNHRGLNVQPSKSRINTKVSNLHTLYQNCSPKMQKGVAFVFFVGKYTLDRGGVPFRLAGGTEVAVRLKLAADAVGRHALKEKAGDFLYRFRLRRVYHHPAVRAFVVAEESCSFRQMKNDSKPLYRYKTFLCSSLRG